MAVTASTAYKQELTGYRSPHDGQLYQGFWDSTDKAGQWKAEYKTVVDPQATAGNWARAYRDEAQSVLDTAGTALKEKTSAIQGVLSGIMQDGSGIDDYLTMATQNYGKINQYAEEAKQAASGITNQVDAVKQNASQITNISDQLGEYAPILRQMSEQMFGTGGDLIDSSRDYISQGKALLGLNRNAEGLAGTYAQIIGMLDPSLAVTTAANDTRTAYEAADAASQRNLARQGVSSGSGVSRSMAQQAGQALAAAVAGIKTKTRQSSVESYLSAIRGAVADATNLGSTGAGIAAQGVSAQAQAANTMQSAAGILVDQGQLLGTAGNLNAQAGQLLGTQANALTSAGQLTVSGGNLALGAANAKIADTQTRVTAAGTNLQAAQSDYNADSTLASFYAGMFNSLAAVAGDKLFG